ncbi:MAG TPA: hypothetical protein VKX25_22520 [Bryobacteraceae bacterium]|nr:hypothetical protein [Bryobacteraceae bacterium]
MPTDHLTVGAGAMEGGGAYNAHARLQASGAALAFPLLVEALDKVSTGPEERPLVIADYGSSQGKNSLVPVEIAVSAFRKRFGPTRPIMVFHIDRSENDFNSLFDVLQRDEHRYTASDPHVFPAAIGRSFYDAVLPPESVDLGWCSYAAIWLSRAPARIPGHIVAIRSDNGVRFAFALQAGADWQQFLERRAAELRPGARLVVVLPGIDEDGQTGYEALFDNGNAVLVSLEEDGILRREERARMVLAAYPRRRAELEAPFGSASLSGLSLEHYEMSAFDDPAWLQYQQDGDAQALGLKRALLFRATFLPTLLAAASPDRTAADCACFAAAFTDRLALRFASDPSPLRSYVQTLVIAKA